MLFDNEIVEKITRIKNTEFVLATDSDATTNAASKIPVIGHTIIQISFQLAKQRSNSKRVGALLSFTLFEVLALGACRIGGRRGRLYIHKRCKGGSRG